ncbi:hypothetical protein [Rhodococcus maanshanensis]|uniref:Uncharacterized protein n=1 Tax=Rhodococcus maanshanensis TaxID=183556 RepID=A0A1H7G603_9NOCA|nr:hypothetical protein [Rhodococcus maanshanensis]SEK31890.1 hypothetical protein SAMN05444583_101345 [Rhodococcus maanshanensis]
MNPRAFTDYIDHIGDRTGLYIAVAEHTGARRVIYPGSYLDLAPSYVWDDVTYLDSDARAHRAFTGTSATHAARARKGYSGEPQVAFHHGDYTHTLLELPTAAWDLAISLYAGQVSEHVKRCLHPQSWLLVNNSHADAGLAHLDPDYLLAAVIDHRRERYALTTTGLDRYLQPRRPPHPTRDQLRSNGRGVAYTHPATAYLFRYRPSPVAS